jgi:hypothetical protein
LTCKFAVRLDRGQQGLSVRVDFNQRHEGIRNES